MKQRFSLGFASVILLFFVLYAAFVNLKNLPIFRERSGEVEKITQELDGFTTEPKQIGQIGGFHLLGNLRLETTSEVYRLIIPTSMEREVVGEKLALPLTRAALVESGEELRVELILTDTTLSGPAQTLTPQEGPLLKVQTTLGPTENQTKILVELKEKFPFRLRGDESKGEIYLELAK